MNATDRAIAEMQSLQSLLDVDECQAPEIKSLKDQILSLNRMLAAVVIQAGGRVSVDDATFFKIGPESRIETFQDLKDRATVIRVIP